MKSPLSALKLAKDLNFELVFNSVPDPYLVLSPELFIVAVSDAYLKATMTKRVNILEKYLFDIFPNNPKEFQATGMTNLRASLNRVLKNKVTDSMAIQKYDIRRPRSEGGGFEVRYWSPVNIPVFNDEGDLCWIIHRVEDVTEFLRIKEKLVQGENIKENLDNYSEKIEVEILERNSQLKIARENIEETQSKLMLINSLLNGIIEGTDHIIAAYDLDSNLIHYNTAYRDEYKKIFSHDVFHGMNLINDLAYLPNDQKKVKQAFEQTIKEGEYHITEEYGDNNCERHYYDVDYNLLKDDRGKVIGLFHIATNVTKKVQEADELRKSEEALRHANKELESFSYSVSHDLRSPLRAIDGFSKILEDKYMKQLPAEAQRFLGLVRSSAVEMGELIDDLLTFSRLGRQEMVHQNISMNELVNEIVNSLKIANQDANIEIIVDDLPIVEGDRNLLKHVLINLISNAMKFTRKKPNRKIKIGSEIQHGITTYYVKDNGAGFDMCYANKLFGVFQRLHSADEFEGTGVGLAIVERIVTRHNGKVWAKAEVNKGATFYFTLKEKTDCGR